MGIIHRFTTGARRIAEDLRYRVERPLRGNGVDAIALLRRQHRDLESLFTLIGDAAPSHRQGLFDELADALVLHLALEETLFYPATRSVATAELLGESAEEHLLIKRLLADMMTVRATDTRFGAKLSVLEEEVARHLEEEEQQLFPQVRNQLDQESLLELGSMMEAMVGEVQERQWRSCTATLTEVPTSP